MTKCTHHESMYILSIFWYHIHCFYLILNPNVWGLSYLSLTMPIPSLLMPWRCKDPGHQQPWYWLYKLGMSLSYISTGVNWGCIDRCQCLLPRWTTHAVVKTFVPHSALLVCLNSFVGTAIWCWKINITSVWWWVNLITWNPEKLDD